MYKIVFTKQVVKDLEKLKKANISQKAKALVDLIRENPYQNPPRYEKLVGNLDGILSRRINIQHRLVYEVYEEPFDENGDLKDGRLKIGKIFSAIVLVIQWNYLLYMLPTRTFWGFLFFFLILIAFFLDIKLVLVSGVACMVSLFIGWFLRGTDLLPVKDE